MPVDPDPNRDQTPSTLRQVGANLLLFMVLLMVMNLFLFQPPQYPTVAYSDFIAQVKAGEVAQAEIGPNHIRYHLKGESLTGESADEPQSPPVFDTIPVGVDVELPKLLQEYHVKFFAPPPSELGWLQMLLGWVMPPLIFFGIWAWLMNRSQQGGPASLTVGQSKARIYSEGVTGVTFDDVAGVDEAKAELQEIVDFLKHAGKYTHLGAKIPKGVLLVGPPGTGKTLLARAVAGEARVPFFSISGSEFIELFVGVGAARVRDLFDQAKQQAPCIVFIDELDALGKSRVGPGLWGGHEEREQTLNQLLSEMDGFEPNTGVILLAATNRPEVLDPALLRPGRFDRQVVVDRPDKIGREAILNVHTLDVILAEDVDLAKIAARTPGFAGADLANLVNEAALLAARKNRQAVTMEDFNEAIERILTGLEKKSRVLNDLEKKTVAYHETGHAIIGSVMPGAGAIEKISVVPRGIAALGYTLQLPEEDRFLMLASELRGRLATLLGGRSAEELVFGEVSTGASDDIQKATDLAERFVTLYGMSEKLGPIAFEKTQQQFLEGVTNPRRSISPQVAEEIDHEVKEMITAAHHMALTILDHNRDLLEDIAQILLDQEVLEGADLKQYLHRVQRPTELAAWLRGESPRSTQSLPTALKPLLSHPVLVKTHP
jgi:cell division protease FtsH